MVSRNIHSALQNLKRQIESERTEKARRSRAKPAKKRATSRA
jgi:hypothetical protein